MNLDKEAIQLFIEQDINPVLSLHLGEARVVDFVPETSTVVLRLLGGCAGCPSSALTLYNGIVPRLEEKFPGILIELG